jgi:hypothetical protein
MSKTLIVPVVGELSADKIIKTINSIIGKDSRGNELFSFKGISDFSSFSLADDAEWDTEDDPVLTLQQQNAQLLLTSAQQAQMFNDLQTQNAAIMLQLAQLKQGGVS